ncbi:disintegrin and metalloproteinase domain-containing protein 19-like isoform X2 [Narcine bancroftii]
MRLLFLLWCQLLNGWEGENGESGRAEGLAVRGVSGIGTGSHSPTGVGDTGDIIDEPYHTQRLLEELTDYRVVFPYVMSGKTKRSLAALSQENHPNRISIGVESAGEEFILDLSRNTILLPRGFQVSHYNSNGTLVTEQHWQQNQCFYEGSVRHSPGSTVSASTCSGLSALVVLWNRTYVIECLGNPEDGQHLMYTPEDLKSVPSRCGVTDTAPEPTLAEELQHLFRMKRDVLQEMKYVELVLVADNAEYQYLGSKKQAVVKRMLNIANTVDMYYRPFNIRVALIGVEVWTRDQITVDRDGPKILSRFLQWQKRSLLPRLPNDSSHLILGGILKGSTAGLALFGSICSASQSGGVSVDSQRNFLAVSATLAHELGHNLGLSHDTRDRKCHCTDIRAGCIMEEAVGFDLPSMFSSCSRDDLERNLLHGGGICLFNMPKVDMLVGGPRCGNMYVEEGEQCDCGTVEPQDQTPCQRPDLRGLSLECSDPCCQPSNCQLSPGAVCSSSGVCCHDCQFLPAGTVCRPKRGECDLPEFCTGKSQDCPNNNYVKDGYSCSNGIMYCSFGTCQSADQQCQEIWGDGAKSAEAICYEIMNTRGNKFGNCGQNENNEYIKCRPENILCGKIQCKDGNTTPLRGGTLNVIISSLTYNGVKYKCRGTFAAFDDANMVDLVQRGTRCGHEKICIDGACRHVSLFDIDSCDRTCNNKGVCNNNNNCYCADGWAPPYCNSTGSGGSVDSGPLIAEPSQSSETRATMTTVIQYSRETVAPMDLSMVLPAVLLPLLAILLIGITIAWLLWMKKFPCRTQGVPAGSPPSAPIRTSEDTYVFVSDTGIVQSHRAPVDVPMEMHASLPKSVL